MIEGRKKVKSLFLDSGAHSLYTEEVIKKGRVYREGGGIAAGHKFYSSKEFWKYVDMYAAFVKKNKRGIDYYVNVDAIFDAEKSWEVLKYLENEHGLKPLPVIHYGASIKWIEKHLNAGYKFLGIGGLGQMVTSNMYRHWADRVFNFLCPGPSHMPLAKTHGFAMTAFWLMRRYPWWSVDSASWAKVAGYGSIYVPHQRNGKFTFEVDPYVIAFSHQSTATKLKGKHFYNLTSGEKKILRGWLEKIDMPLGKVDSEGETIDYGVISEYNARAVANLKYFEELCKWLPKWPWAFQLQPQEGFLSWEQLK